MRFWMRRRKRRRRLQARGRRGNHRARRWNLFRGTSYGNIWSGMRDVCGLRLVSCGPGLVLRGLRRDGGGGWTGGTGAGLAGRLDETASKLDDALPLPDVAGTIDLEDFERRMTVLGEKLAAAL